MRARARCSLPVATLILAFPVAKAANNEPFYTTWSDYLGSADSMQYSALAASGTLPRPRYETKRGVKA